MPASRWISAKPTKLEYAKQLAAALGFVGLIRTDRVRIETLGQAANVVGRCSEAERACGGMLDYLNSIEAGETTSLADGVKTSASETPGKASSF